MSMEYPTARIIPATVSDIACLGARKEREEFRTGIREVRAILRQGHARLSFLSAYGPRVAYLRAAENVLGRLPSRLRGVHQPVIRSRNPIARSHPARLSCI